MPRNAVEFSTREFERAINDVMRESDRSDFEIVTMNARTLVKSLVYNTPRDTGTTRAGFWPAWEALEMYGTPGTRRAYAPWQKKKRTYIPEGRVEDKRKERGDPSFAFVNRSHYRDAKGRKTFYPYILNARANFWGRGLEEAAFKFERIYERLLRKHSKL